MFKGIRTLVAGILAGATLGILFSPKKGEEIRKKIKEEMDDGGSGINAVKNTAVEFSKNLGGTISETYDEISESEAFKNGSKKVKMETGKLIKEHTTAAQRKKAKVAFKKAKKTTSEVVKKAKKVIKKATDELSKNKE